MAIDPAAGAGAAPGVRVMSAGSTAAPLRVSLSRTLSVVVPPAKPFWAVGVSALAAMTGASTVTLAEAVAQLAGLRTSQMV